ncbi:hypothetical protein [Novosphingobium lindaniclasticum]
MTLSTDMQVPEAAWLAHRYDPAQDSYQFRRIERSGRQQVPFLTDEHLGVETSPVVIRRQALADWDRAAGCQPHFIFHSAFCASTMLVQALDQPGIAAGLSEPVLLNDLIGWRRRGADPRQMGEVAADMLALMARPFVKGERTVIKPSNIVNPIIPALMNLAPDSRAVLLYAPLEPFLLSVVRKGLWCRIWCRQLAKGYLVDRYLDFGFSPEELFLQTDLQIAALGWLAQQRHFAQIAAQMPDRVATLDSEALTRRPVDSVAAVLRHYRLPVPDRDVLAGQPALHRDSKSGDAFSAGQRQRDQDTARMAHRDEIGTVLEWASTITAAQNIPLELPNALNFG